MICPLCKEIMTQSIPYYHCDCGISINPEGRKNYLKEPTFELDGEDKKKYIIRSSNPVGPNDWLKEPEYINHGCYNPEDVEINPGLSSKYIKKQIDELDDYLSTNPFEFLQFPGKTKSEGTLSSPWEHEYEINPDDELYDKDRI